MSNDKFHFEFKRRIPKIKKKKKKSSRSKKKLQLLFISKFIIFICLKKKYISKL